MTKTLNQIKCFRKHKGHDLALTFYFLNIYQIRNCRVSNINKLRPTKMYLSQFLITSGSGVKQHNPNTPNLFFVFYRKN
jgi:hypothetical protein